MKSFFSSLMGLLFSVKSFFIFCLQLLNLFKKYDFFESATSLSTLFFKWLLALLEIKPFLKCLKYIDFNFICRTIEGVSHDFDNRFSDKYSTYGGKHSLYNPLIRSINARNETPTSVGQITVFQFICFIFETNLSKFLSE